MKLSLQNKLMLPILATLLIFMGVSAFLLWHLITKQIEDHTADMMHAGNSILVKNIKNATSTYKVILSALTRMPPVWNMAAFLDSGALPDGVNKTQIRANLQAFLENLPGSYPKFSEFTLVDVNARPIASSGKIVREMANIHQLGAFRDAMKGHDAISEPLLTSHGEKIVIATTPVRSPSGKISAVLCAMLPCRWIIADTIEGTSIGKTGYGYIVDGLSGLMLAHNVEDKVQSMNMFDYQPWMRHLQDGESGIKTDYTDSQGNRRLAVYHKDPVSHWIAVSCLAKEELEDQATLIRNSILACTMGSAFLVAVILIFITRSVTNDVHETNRFAQAVAAGRLDSTLAVQRNDELGALSEAMRKMAGSIKRMMQMAAEEAQERELNLTIMRDAIMTTLADLVESRDVNTGQHIRKTAAYVRIIVEELKRKKTFGITLTDEFAENVVKAAPLHDIGKINVPDAILNKPGKLTDEEFAIMKTHAAVGGQIIGHIIDLVPVPQYLVEAKDVATYHHEKWNGRGYPEGLAEESIPLSARIMAVADVFDALVSNRAYKKGFPLEKAFAILREESGSHFDPRIIEAFFSAKEEIIRVEEAFRDSEGTESLA
ncbi:MAG: HD domain-containing protein [Desulfovibrio sp.]|nr:HD domain-containing protein [Desulfovibrio sp.]